MDDNKCFNALKKCNDTGSKLNKKQYILYDGMILCDKIIEDSIAPCYGISIISDKLVKDLDALNYLGLEIEPTELSDLYKKYDFDRFMIDSKYLHIIFKGLYVSDEDFSHDFIEHALNSTCKSKEHISDQLARGFDSDIDLYELYVKFKKNYSNAGNYHEFVYKAKIINKSDIINKINSIINKIENGNMFAYREFDSDIFERISESEKPIDITFNNNDKIFKMRIMKSLFRTCVKSSKISIRIIQIGNGDEFYVIVYVDNKSFNNISIYKALNY